MRGAQSPRGCPIRRKTGGYAVLPSSYRALSGKGTPARATIGANDLSCDLRGSIGQTIYNPPVNDGRRVGQGRKARVRWVAITRGQRSSSVCSKVARGKIPAL